MMNRIKNIIKKKFLLFLYIILLVGCQREITSPQFEKNTSTQETTAEEYILVEKEIVNNIVDWQELLISLPVNSKWSDVCVENNVVYFGINYIKYLYESSDEPSEDIRKNCHTQLISYDIETKVCQVLYSTEKTENSIRNIQYYENKLYWQENSVLDMLDETKTYQLDIDSGSVNEISADEMVYVEQDNQTQIDAWQENNEQEYLYLKDLKSEQKYKLKVNTVDKYIAVDDCVIISGYNLRVYRIGDDCMNTIIRGAKYGANLSVNRDGVIYGSKYVEETGILSVVLINAKVLQMY